MDKKLDDNGLEKDFKLFRQIEATIEGILEFIIRFIRTTAFLILHPTRVKRLTVVGENDLSFTRPAHVSYNDNSNIFSSGPVCV